MSVPMISGGFGDLVDRRVTKVFWDRYNELPQHVPTLYRMDSSSDQYETVSNVGALGDWPAFGGSVTYQDQFQGYDMRATHVEFASGIQIERALYDDDRHGVWEGRPRALATSANRTREKHGARILNNAFSVDTFFYNNSEGISLCSNAHTTTNPNASTAVGFDNLTTSSLSAVSLVAARIQMMNYRDDAGNKMSFMPDELWIPIDLYDKAYEIVKSSGQLDSGNNNANVHKGMFKIMPTEAGWNYLTDVNNWFLCDSTYRKDMLTWYDRVPMEFAFAEEIDSLIAKWRGYMRYSCMWNDWRWILGALVS